MKFTWIKTQHRTPKTEKNFLILSENVLAKMPNGEYREVFYNKSNKRWYDTETNKKNKGTTIRMVRSFLKAIDFYTKIAYNKNTS